MRSSAGVQEVVKPGLGPPCLLEQRLERVLAAVMPLEGRRLCRVQLRHLRSNNRRSVSSNQGGAEQLRPGPPYALIHRSAWKGDFCELRAQK